MRYTLMITATPLSGRGGARGLGFARALLAEGHSLVRVFFYREGVQVALNSAALESWQEITHDTATELVICSASAEHYGISAPPHGCVIAGLGSLMEAGIDSDRVIRFA